MVSGERACLASHPTGTGTLRSSAQEPAATVGPTGANKGRVGLKGVVAGARHPAYPTVPAVVDDGDGLEGGDRRPLKDSMSLLRPWQQMARKGVPTAVSMIPFCEGRTGRDIQDGMRLVAGSY